MRAPLTITGAAWQVSRVKGKLLVPPLKDTVRVKLIVVPQTNVFAVLTENGIVLPPVAPSLIFAYGEFGWVIVTPGVEVESTPEMPVPSRHPSFRIVTLTLLHSLGSMMPSPSPPVTEIADD
jgi:hypothetical protein